MKHCPRSRAALTPAPHQRPAIDLHTDAAAVSNGTATYQRDGAPDGYRVVAVTLPNVRARDNDKYAIRNYGVAPRPWWRRAVRLHMTEAEAVEVIAELAAAIDYPLGCSDEECICMCDGLGDE